MAMFVGIVELFLKRMTFKYTISLYDENERIYWMVKYRKLKEKYNKLKNMSLKENDVFKERLIEELEKAMIKGDRQKELEIREKLESYLGPTAEEMEDYSDYI